MGHRFKILILLLFTGSHLNAADCKFPSELEENPDTRTKIQDEDYLESAVQRNEYIQFIKKTSIHHNCVNKQVVSMMSEINKASADREMRSQLILELERKINELSESGKKSNQELISLGKKHKRFKKEVESSEASIQNFIENLRLTHESRMESIEGDDKELRLKLEQTNNMIKQLSERLADSDNKIDNGLVNLDNTLSDKTLYGIISILVIILFIILMFLLLRNKIFKQKTDLNTDLENMKKEIDEESIKLDNKLISLIETQISIESSKEPSADEIDHSLALKVADEVVRIQKNTLRMDTKTKGLKQLVAAVKRIQDNFSSNGYDIVEMLNQPYDEGMKVSASFIIDENLDEHEEVITRIIKPQVNYKGVMIQAAQIEVSIGE